MECYPLTFKPIFKERLWGGTKLKAVLNKDAAGDHIGESWEISWVPGDASVVDNGPYAGRTLPDLIAAFPEDLLGRSVLQRFGTEFPLLIKFIDAREDLSIQLHPGDELARKRHNSFGKTEMWYIMDADPGSELIVGFEKDVTRPQYEEALETGTLTDLLHYRQVRRGDGFFINSGKIHAIGAGILLAEIQQSSDVTYRVYDFERRGPDGKLRELHTDLALDAMDFRRKDDFEMRYSRELNQPNAMVESPYFTTRYLKLDQAIKRPLQEGEAFTIYMCVSGSARIAAGIGEEMLKMGETLLTPAAAASVTIQTDGCELLEVTV